MDRTTPTKRKLWTLIVITAVVLGAVRLVDLLGYEGTGTGTTVLFVVSLIALVAATIGIGVVSVTDRIRS